MRRFLIRAAALAALFAMATPSAAFADDGVVKNPLSPDLLNAVVTVVVFLSLLAVLYKFAWGPISQGLAAREDAQFKALEEAKLAREEAASMRTSVQAELAKAHDEIRGLMDEARRDAEQLRAKERESGVKDAAAERERAKREIEAARDAALQDLYRQSVDLAAMLTEKTIGRHIGSEDHRRLFDESLAELAEVGKPTA